MNIRFSAPEPSQPLPWIALKPETMLRTAAAVALFAMGMHYLVTGRKEADLQRMILGALLSIASLVVL